MARQQGCQATPVIFQSTCLEYFKTQPHNLESSRDMRDLKIKRLSYNFHICEKPSAKHILEIHQSQNGLPYLQLWVARWVYGSHLANGRPSLVSTVMSPGYQQQWYWQDKTGPSFPQGSISLTRVVWVLSRNKPLPEPMLTKACNGIWMKISIMHLGHNHLRMDQNGWHVLTHWPLEDLNDIWDK